MNHSPLRIAVRGASSICVKSERPDTHRSPVFSRVIEAELRRRDHDAMVTAITVPGETSGKTLGSWERDYLGLQPDVAIFLIGHYETIHLLAPSWLERHANSRTWPQSAVQVWYRRLLLRPFWRTFRRTQGHIDSRMPAVLTRRRLRRVAANLAEILNQLQRSMDPLVIVMEIPMPGPVGRRAFPGITQRVTDMNQLLADVVASRNSPDVRLYRTTHALDTMTGGDPDTAVPDGFHLSAEFHVRVGRELADEIDIWAAKRPDPLNEY